MSGNIGPSSWGDIDDDEFERRLQERYDAALHRWRQNTPRCLDGFVTRAASLPGHAFDGHGGTRPDNEKILALGCRCGGSHFTVLGYNLTTDRGTRIFVSPLALRCSSCSAATELIDTARHGHDAELGSPYPTKRGAGERTAYRCACGGDRFAAVARFEYPGDIFEDSVGNMIGNEHNLFSWFSLVGDCAACGRRAAVADFECA